MAGRPPKFKNEEEFSKSIDAYLENCDKANQLPNIAGYCAFNKIHRDTYYEYANIFSDTKKVFEALIETAWVNRLGYPGATGAIFYLKNAFRERYADRVEQDITTKGEKIVNNEELKKLSDQFNEFIKSPRQD